MVAAVPGATIASFRHSRVAWDWYGQMHRHLPVPPTLAAARSTEQSWPKTAGVVFALLFAVTFGTAILVAAVPPLNDYARETLQALGLDLRPHRASVHALLVTRVLTNALIALTPTEWALIGAGRSRQWRPAADATLTAMFATDAVLVGSALGAYGLQLVPFIPHLPFEWAALACAVVPWLVARRGPLDRQVLAPLGATAVLLLVAGCAETWLTPHT
jgi:hypothetical protein